MNERVEKTLGKNEKILWIGKPQKSKLMDEDVKATNIRTILISAAICVALVGGYLYVCFTKGIEIMWAVLAVIVALSALGVLHIYTCWHTLNRVIYVITNKRVMIWHSEDKVISLSRKKITEFTVVTGKNGFDSLCIGTPATAIPMHKLRHAGVEGVSEEVSENVYVEYPVFYNIADAKGAAAILSEI